MCAVGPGGREGGAGRLAGRGHRRPASREQVPALRGPLRHGEAVKEATGPQTREPGAARTPQQTRKLPAFSGPPEALPPSPRLPVSSPATPHTRACTVAATGTRTTTAAPACFCSASRGWVGAPQALQLPPPPTGCSRSRGLGSSSPEQKHRDPLPRFQAAACAGQASGSLHLRRGPHSRSCRVKSGVRHGERDLPWISSVGWKRLNVSPESCLGNLNRTWEREGMVPKDDSCPVIPAHE